VRTIQIYIVCLLAGLNRFNEIRGHSHHRLTMDDWNILTEDKTLCDHEVKAAHRANLSIYLCASSLACTNMSLTAALPSAPLIRVRSRIE